MNEEYMNLEKGLVLKWVADEVPESPREWSNLGTFITFDRDYNSPDKHDFDEPIDFISDILGEETTERIYEKHNNTNDFLDDVIPKMNKKGFIVYPVTAHEHGNIVYYLGASSGWDTRVAGFIYVEKETMYKEFSTKRITKKVMDNIERIFTGELETYTRYANGDVHGFVIEDFEGNHLDSCYGFYEDGYSLEEVLEVVSGYYDLGNKEDWQDFDEAEIEKYLYDKELSPFIEVIKKEALIVSEMYFKEVEEKHENSNFEFLVLYSRSVHDFANDYGLEDWGKVKGFKNWIEKDEIKAYIIMNDEDEIVGCSAIYYV